MLLSVVIPVYNEEKSICGLFSEIRLSLESFKDSYEIIFVNDGSTDQTLKICRKLSDEHVFVKTIQLRRNFGQTTALIGGCSMAKGKYIVTMDGDMQNNPADIPLMLEEIENEKVDMVVGWRKNRKDHFFKRTNSRIGYFLRKYLLKDKIHDSGCTLRIFKKELIGEINLQGEMHRYFSQMVMFMGYSVKEMVVDHRPRTHGVSKYNLLKLPKGFLDLLLVYYYMNYSSRPIHLFGGIGLFLNIVGFFIGLYLIYVKFAYQQDIGTRPLLLLSVLLMISGLQLILLGVVLDSVVKNNTENIKYKTYIKEIY